MDASSIARQAAEAAIAASSSSPAAPGAGASSSAATAADGDGSSSSSSASQAAAAAAAFGPIDVSVAHVPLAEREMRLNSEAAQAVHVVGAVPERRFYMLEVPARVENPQAVVSCLRLADDAEVRGRDGLRRVAAGVGTLRFAYPTALGEATSISSKYMDKMMSLEGDSRETQQHLLLRVRKRKRKGAPPDTPPEVQVTVHGKVVRETRFPVSYGYQPVRASEPPQYGNETNPLYPAVLHAPQLDPREGYALRPKAAPYYFDDEPLSRITLFKRMRLPRNLANEGGLAMELRMRPSVNSVERQDLVELERVAFSSKAPVPKTPRRVVVPNQDLLRILKKTFAARPIICEGALAAHRELQNEFEWYQVKRHVPALAYQFKNGPWRKCYVRLGYDPRFPDYVHGETDEEEHAKRVHEALGMQVVDLKVPRALLRKLGISHNTKAAGIDVAGHQELNTKITHDPRFTLAPRRTITTYQLRDLVLPEASALVSQPVPLANYKNGPHNKYGYATRPQYDAIEQAMRERLMTWVKEGPTKKILVDKYGNKVSRAGDDDDDDDEGDGVDDGGDDDDDDDDLEGESGEDDWTGLMSSDGEGSSAEEEEEEDGDEDFD